MRTFFRFQSLPLAVPTLSLLVSVCFFWDWPGIAGGAYQVDRTCDVALSAGMVLSSLFVHANFTHWASNTMTTLLVGLPLEGLHGAWRAACIYLGSGLAGVFFFAAWREDGVRYVGASPAVYGLIASFGAHLALNWAEVPLRVYWLLVLCIYVGIDTTNAMESLDDPDNRVAHLSHLGGAIGGLFLALALLRNQVFLRWEAALVFAGIAGYVAFLAGSIFESTCG
jgi:membrane associated rhomboid family serine protease